MRQITVKFNERTYLLNYDEKTEYYEIELEAPKTGGIYTAEINYTDILDETESKSIDIQVLLKEKKEVESNTTLAYFYDKYAFEIKEVVELLDYEKVIDEETNAKSSISTIKKINVKQGDFVFIKENKKIIYAGILDTPTREDGEEKTTIMVNYITNLFDTDVLVKNEEIIKTKGIEDFIKQTIEEQITKTDDELLNYDYIEVIARTHTIIYAAVESTDGLFNLHTYMTNASQNYNISYDIEITRDKLRIIISKNNFEEPLVDANIEDIANFKEASDSDVVAKVIVYVKDTDKKYEYFLLSDRTISEDKNNVNRAVGRIERRIITAAKTEEETRETAKQTAQDAFKGNRYNHLNEFDVREKSLIYDLNNWKIGMPMLQKTKENKIVETYISAMSKKMGEEWIHIKTGNLRDTILDKLLIEKRKRK